MRLLFSWLKPDFSPKYLIEIWEDIKKDYEKESKDNSVSEHLADLNEQASELNELTKLKAIYGLMRLGDELAIKELAEIGIVINAINADSIKLVWTEIQSLQTNIEIGMMVEGQKIDKASKDEFNFYKSVQNLSNLFQRNIPINITLIEWIYLVESAKEFKKRYKNAKSGHV